jgi:hypothetical protein
MELDTLLSRTGARSLGRYENLSGAISWLTFFAGGAADVRRILSESRGAFRINVWAVSCGGFRPLMMAVVGRQPSKE